MEIVLNQALTTPAQDQLVVDVKTALVDTGLLADALAESVVPTKLSELQNDTGFITADQVPDTTEAMTNDEIDTVIANA